MNMKLISVLILISMLFAALPTTQAVPVETPASYATLAAFENAIEDIPEPSALTEDKSEYEELYLSPTSDWEYESRVLSSIEKEVINAILNGESSLDISRFKINSDKINLNTLKYFSPYISGGIDISCWYNSKSIYSKIEITCPLSQSEVNTRFSEIDKKVSEINSLLDSVSTDLEKALILHDYLAYTGEYDYDNLLEGTVPNDSYRSAGILIDKKGVCQSYAYAFKYFMNREDIECHIVSSKKMNHAWNIIKLGPSYYHVDVTWDDPVRDSLGQVLHNHFLLSDRAISFPRGTSKDFHYAWDDSGISCNNPIYDNSYWTDVTSSICFSGTDRYFIRNNNIIKRNAKSGRESTVVKMDKWPTWDNLGYWFGSFSGLWLSGDKLYYNSAKDIRCIDIRTLSDKIVYTPSTKSGNIFGSAVKGDSMYYVLKQNPDEIGSMQKVPLNMLKAEETVNLEQKSIVMNVGDSTVLNVSGKNISNALLTWKSDDTSVATVTGDGTVTAKGSGSAYITVTTPSGVSDKCLVTVTAAGHTINSAEMFSDIKKSSWFKDAVDHVVSIGLMNGTSPTRFEPNATMNRAMLVTVLWRLEGSPKPDTTTPFTDLKQAWYRDAVAWAYSREIVNGTTDTKFSPSMNITREQMATILYRYSSYKGYDTSKSADVMTYPDGKNISSYAKSSMAWANGAGLITGKPSGNSLLLATRGNATRAEVATILMRYLELYKLLQIN